MIELKSSWLPRVLALPSTAAKAKVPVPPAIWTAPFVPNTLVESCTFEFLSTDLTSPRVVYPVTASVILNFHHC
jgi:hypothetical protein